MRWRAALQARGGLLILAGLLGGVANMLPPVPRSGVVFEHLLVLDITQSMNVVDQALNGKPVSRLRFAQHAITSALAELPCGSGVGIAVFAKRRTLMLLSPVEICANRFALHQAIEQVDGRMAWEQGSQVARGLFSAIASAPEWSRTASLLFFTDGHEAPPLDDDDIAAFTKPALHVPGALIGVGGTTPQPIPRTDSDGQPAGWWQADMVTQRSSTGGQVNSREHLSSLQEAHVRALAQLTGLDYVRLDSPTALRRVMTDRRFARGQTVATDMRWLPAWLAGLSLLAFYLPLPNPSSREAGSPLRLGSIFRPRYRQGGGGESAGDPQQRSK